MGLLLHKDRHQKGMFHIPNGREETSERVNKESIYSEVGWPRLCGVDEEDKVNGATSHWRNSVVDMCMIFIVVL